MAIHVLDQLEPKPAKSSHKNPEEAATFVKMIEGLVTTFLDVIQLYSKYEKEDAYELFICNYKVYISKIDGYFEGADITTILDTIDDKMCKLITVLKPDPKTKDEADKFQPPRMSVDNIPAGHYLLCRLVREPNHKQPKNTEQKKVVTLFTNLQATHDALANIARDIATPGRILGPNKFTFIMWLCV